MEKEESFITYREAIHFFEKLPYYVPLKCITDEFAEKYDKNLNKLRELVDRYEKK